LIPVIVNKKKRSNGKENVIALDAYVRTFQTGVSTKGHFMEFEKQDIGKLFVLGKKIDKIQSKIDKHKKGRYSSVEERTLYNSRKRKWRNRSAILR